MAAKLVTIYIKDNRGLKGFDDEFLVYSEEEMSRAIAEGDLEDDDEFYEFTLPAKPKKLNVGEWSLE